MPYVNTPANHASHPDSPPNTFKWTNDVAPAPYSYKVAIGSSQGDSDIYPGRQVLHPTLQDNQVIGLPRGGVTCYTDVRYRKSAGGAWWGIGDQFTDFTCT